MHPWCCMPLRLVEDIPAVVDILGTRMPLLLVEDILAVVGIPAVVGILGMRMHLEVGRHPWMNMLLVVVGRAWNCSFGMIRMGFEEVDNFPLMNMLQLLLVLLLIFPLLLRLLLLQELLVLVEQQAVLVYLQLLLVLLLLFLWPLLLLVVLTWIIYFLLDLVHLLYLLVLIVLVVLVVLYLPLVQLVLTMGMEYFLWLVLQVFLYFRPVVEVFPLCRVEQELLLKVKLKLRFLLVE